MNKYRNKKAKRDGLVFDSQAEARRYDGLLLMQRSGEISDLRVHPRYELQPSFLRDGKRVRAIHYEADFSYLDKSTGWRHTVEDVKGFATKEFLLKKKLFLFRYPHIDLRVLNAKEV